MPDAINAPWFNAQHLPAVPTPAYVAWLDVMGAKGAMLRSLPVAANFVFKLHVTALEDSTNYPGLRLYPVMDGVYVVTESRSQMRDFLAGAFRRLAHCHASEPQQEHRFLVKCAVAYGPVIHGSDVSAAASAVFQQSPQNAAYKDSILIGMPVVFAAQSERQAPPFGVFVHESAAEYLTPAERKRSHIWWEWYVPGTSPEAQALKTQLPTYFDWCEQRAGLLDYDLSRIRAHRLAAAQYLDDA
ncbi:MAG: hypothetical protein M1617_06345 [Actinobacteria bacterium]|nr:hypothetical protein [Actinomycetota bacterium]MCL5887890.1 hypothetical protein [Actinomycetota bacterium]